MDLARGRRRMDRVVDGCTHPLEPGRAVGGPGRVHGPRFGVRSRRVRGRGRVGEALLRNRLSDQRGPRLGSAVRVARRSRGGRGAGGRARSRHGRSTRLHSGSSTRARSASWSAASSTTCSPVAPSGSFRWCSLARPRRYRKLPMIWWSSASARQGSRSESPWRERSTTPSCKPSPSSTRRQDRWPRRSRSRLERWLHSGRWRRRKSASCARSSCASLKTLRWDSSRCERSSKPRLGRWTGSMQRSARLVPSG